MISLFLNCFYNFFPFVGNDTDTLLTRLIYIFCISFLKKVNQYKNTHSLINEIGVKWIYAIGDTLILKIPMILPVRILLINSQNIPWTFSHILLCYQSQPPFHKHPNTLTKHLQSSNQPNSLTNEEFKVRKYLMHCQVSQLVRNLNSWEHGKENNDYKISHSTKFIFLT